MTLPKGWVQVTLGDLADIKSGLTLGKKRPLGTALSKTPYLRVANVQRGALSLHVIKEIDVTEDERSSLALKVGDILLNEGGDRDKLGRGWVWEGQIPDCIHQNHVFRARIHAHCLSPYYISLYANEFGQAYFLEHGTQTTNLASISKGKISALPIPLPPAAEQRRIVTKLDALTARLTRARAELGRSQKLAASLRIAALRSAFFFAKDASDLPEGWVRKRIDEVGSVQLGRQRSPKDHNGLHMRPYVRSANITWKGWDLSDVKTMNFSPAEFETFQLKPGDVLLNEGSGSAKEVGKPAVWTDELAGVCFQNTLLRIRPVGYDPYLLRYGLLYMALSGAFIKNTQGVNIIHIGKTGLARTMITVPPVDQQAHLLEMLDTAFARADRLEAEALRARALLDRLESAILARAFRGELMPQDPADEPAGVLLDRIRAERAAAPKPQRGRRASTGA